MPVHIITVTDGHSDFVIWMYPPYLPFGRRDVVKAPTGYEACIVRDGVFSDIIHPGYEVPIAARKGECQVYFFRRVPKSSVLWGVGDIPFIDPVSGLQRYCGANGEYRFEIVDARRLLECVRDNWHAYEVANVAKRFESAVRSAVTATLSAQLNNSSYQAVYGQLLLMAQSIQTALHADFMALGLQLTQFTIHELFVPDLVEKEETDP